MRLEGKVAVITGGGSGLGKETCKLFVKEGATVIIADYNLSSAESVEHDLIVMGGKALSMGVNVASTSDVQVMVDEVINRFGTIDILINNAGITQDAQLLKMTEEQWDNVIGVNLKGVFNCTKAVAPHMIENGYGKIINTSSIVGLVGNFGQTNYAATKAGVIGLTKTWARELGRKGINVNAVAPGFIETPMVKKMPENVLNSMREKVFMRRLGQPIEIANTYLFLASDESSFINGAVISADGGISL